MFYGAPVLGFALLWLLIAARITLRSARPRLPFSLAWWSFTFPVGTLVTGASALGARTGSTAVDGLAVAAYALLAAAWLRVATRTARAAVDGSAFAPAPPAAPGGSGAASPLTVRTVAPATGGVAPAR